MLKIDNLTTQNKGKYLIICLIMNKKRARPWQCLTKRRTFAPKYKTHFFIINQRTLIMYEEKAGELAGKIWEALNEGGKLTGKELKKATKARSEKDLYLGLGWLLREGKLDIVEVEKDIEVALKA